MKKLFLAFTLIFLAVGSAFAQPPAVIKAYIENYRDIAIAEMKRTGVPAAIKLAQGIHETAAGQSKLVLKSNNHFGIKCKAEWRGEWVSHDDDAKGECFRKYADPFDSYKDHSDFLKTRSHYSSLFDLDPMDYEGWAHGLKKAGYATNPKYPQIIIKLIKDYNLQDYTLIAMGKKNPQEMEIWAVNTEKKEEPVAEKKTEVVTAAIKKTYPSGVFKINETNVVFVPKGTSFLVLANQYKIPLARLFEFNDLKQQEEATKDQLIFIQRKRKTGAHETHTVVAGETLHDIAQEEAIRLESLLAYNLLKDGMMPGTGEVLYLHKQAPAMPKLAMAVDKILSDISNATAAVTAKVSNKATPEEYTVHIVQPKETMYSISKKYSVTQDELMKWNDLPTPDLKTGQELRINKKM